MRRPHSTPESNGRRRKTQTAQWKRFYQRSASRMTCDSIIPPQRLTLLDITCIMCCARTIMMRGEDYHEPHNNVIGLPWSRCLSWRWLVATNKFPDFPRESIIQPGGLWKTNSARFVAFQKQKVFFWRWEWLLWFIQLIATSRRFATVFACSCTHREWRLLFPQNIKLFLEWHNHVSALLTSRGRRIKNYF